MSRVMVVTGREPGRLAPLLRSEGLETETVTDEDEIGRMVAKFEPLLVVLEVSEIVPTVVTLCQRTTAWTSVPVAIVCDTYDEAQVLAGYEAGAATVLTDATRPREMLARARALIRRAQVADPPSDDVVVVGPVVLDRACRRLTVSGQLVPLPRREFEIAEALMRRAGTVVTRRSLLVELWGGSMRDSKSLDVQVGRLRARLAAVEGERRILTVRGVGYRFVTDEDLARYVAASSERGPA